MKHNFVLIFAFFTQICVCQTYLDKREAEIINLQREVVGKLTGHLPIKGKKLLKSRYSTQERKLTANYLFDLLEKSNMEPKKNEYNVKDNKGNIYSGANVYAEIPATNGSDEYVIISSHFDSAKDSPGAVHNATGVAIAYYVAHKISKLDIRNKNFIIVFFDQWKLNLVGTRMFMKYLKDNKYKVHSMHRSDYMGWDNDEDRAIELFTSNISLESMYRNESPVPIYKRSVSTPESRFFSNFGYETVTLTAELKNEDNSPFVSQQNDKYTTVNFKYLASTTNLIYDVMKELAKSNFK